MTPHTTAMTNTWRYKASTNRRWLLLLLGTVAITLTVVLPVVVVLTKDNRQSENAVTRGDTLLENENGGQIETGAITIGQVDGVDYYICRHASSSHSVVLLHGSSFTKEVWKTSGILDITCPHTNVLALDLSISADSIRLRSILDKLHDSNILTLPQVTLVTPSASGRTMVDWLLRGQAASMPDYMTTWVPVAVGRLSSTHITNEQIQAMTGLIDILAIYGDRDTSGGRLSDKLGTLIGATVVELPGGHPVYLESQEAFVANILEFIGIV
jgi:hypothetical protein